MYGSDNPIQMHWGTEHQNGDCLRSLIVRAVCMGKTTLFTAPPMVTEIFHSFALQICCKMTFVTSNQCLVCRAAGLQLTQLRVSWVKATISTKLGDLNRFYSQISTLFLSFLAKVLRRWENSPKLTCCQPLSLLQKYDGLHALAASRGNLCVGTWLRTQFSSRFGARLHENASHQNHGKG